MLGKRKKVNKEETHQKRKWELEFAEGENDSKIENYSLDIKEIPKLVDSDDEKQIVIGEVSDKDIKGQKKLFNNYF